MEHSYQSYKRPRAAYMDHTVIRHQTEMMAFITERTRRRNVITGVVLASFVTGVCKWTGESERERERASKEERRKRFHHFFFFVCVCESVSSPPLPWHRSHVHGIGERYAECDSRARQRSSTFLCDTAASVTHCASCCSGDMLLVPHETLCSFRWLHDVPVEQERRRRLH